MEKIKSWNRNLSLQKKYDALCFDICRNCLCFDDDDRSFVQQKSGENPEALIRSWVKNII